MPSASSLPKPTFDSPAGPCSRFVDAVLTVALAAACAACGQPLDQPSSGAVCPACWATLRVYTPPLCARCGAPLPSGCGASANAGSAEAPDEEAAARCPACWNVDRAVDMERAVGPHEGTLRDVVHALKYHGLVSVAEPLATRMRAVGCDVLRGADAAIPVPLHPAREWRRGFNQAELLAREIGLPVVHALCRARATAPQTGLGSRERRRNVREAFALAAFPSARGAARWINVIHRWDARQTAAWVAGRVLVLVDDVSTTGATLDACARTLKAAGARQVRAITAARAVPAPR